MRAGKTLLPRRGELLAACDSRMSEQSETRLIDGRTDGRGWEIGGGGVREWFQSVFSADLEPLLPEKMRRRGVRSFIPAAAVRD